MCIKLRFSPWVKWADRLTLNKLDCPGIYVLAVSTKDISDQKFSWLKSIQYIGMTNAGLKGRLSQFNNTLLDKKGPGHGGAERFRYDYKNGRLLAKKLYVAVCPFSCDSPRESPAALLVRGRVAMAEYVAWANYAKRYGALPKYNDKKLSPKPPKN